MYGNIIQQEQNRKNKASADEAAHKKQKTEGLLSMLKGGKQESVQEKHGKLRAKGYI